MSLFISEKFDDIYFSREDGYAETLHVFIHGNDLQQRFKNHKNFVIMETGFGSGLNMLIAAYCFERAKLPPSYSLHLYSCEKYPLTTNVIADMLAPFRAQLEPYYTRMLEQYPWPLPGWHRIILSANIQLTLIIGDVADVLNDMEGFVDAWFLDGFAPAKNPEMWTETVFSNIGRLSHANSTLATFTAARIVKDGLAKVGFHVVKKPGYGRKRDMIAAKVASNDKRARPEEHASAKKIAVIGGGLAGCANAYTLSEKGYDVSLYEQAAHLASKASGNDYALINPKFGKQNSAVARFYASGYSQLHKILSRIPDCNYNSCGALHLITDSDKRLKFDSMLENWIWPSEFMQKVDAQTASDIARLPLGYDALYLPQSGYTDPKVLCGFYTQKINKKLNIPVVAPIAKDGFWQIGTEYFDALFLCGGMDKSSQDVLRTLNIQLSLRPLSGHVMRVKTNSQLRNLGANLHYGGYLSMALPDGSHMAGSTFHHSAEIPDQESDIQEIYKRLNRVIPILEETLPVVSARGAVRATTIDKNPAIGRLDYNIYPPLYISTGHGSHGIVSTTQAAILNADTLHPYPLPYSRALQRMISPMRFAGS